MGKLLMGVVFVALSLLSAMLGWPPKRKEKP